MDNKKWNTIDLFAGCGGLTEGFEQTGYFESLACVEWEDAPATNLKNRLESKWKYNNVDEKVMIFDIQRTDELINGWNDEKYKYHKGLKELCSDKSVDVIIGGPPCQAYSMAGRVNKANNMDSDYRNYLFESYLKVVEYFKPKVFVFENVEGMLSATPGGTPVIDLITNGFNSIGYEIASDLKNIALLNLSDYGVPQNRKRVIIIGVNKAEFKGDYQNIIKDFYNNILNKYKVKSKTTVGDVINDLPKLYPLKDEVKLGRKKYSHTFSNINIPNHEPRYHNKRDIRIFKDLAYDIFTGEEKYTSSEALKELYTERTGKTGNIHKYHVLRSDSQSNTITAHLCKDGLRHIHPDYKQARSITVREAARLQSFPDDYNFISSAGANYKMIGNAVPPKFSKILAYAINDFINKYLF